MSKPRDERKSRTQTVTGNVVPAATNPAPAMAPALAPAPTKTQLMGSSKDDEGGAFSNVPTWELGGHLEKIATTTKTMIAGSTQPPPIAPGTSGPVVPTTAAGIEVIPGSIDVNTYRPTLELLTAVDSRRSSAYRVLRHQLVSQNPGAVIMVTSANPGEGKSVTALNLALAFAEISPGKTLLVEANFRRPWLARTLALKRFRCFREQMVAQQTQPNMALGVVHVAPSTLHVMAIRPWGPAETPTPFLDAIALARAMYAFRAAGYERIIVDAPAALEAADVNLLQDTCDGILTVVKTRETSATSLRDVVERLSPVRFLGTTLV